MRNRCCGGNGAEGESSRVSPRPPLPHHLNAAIGKHGDKVPRCCLCCGAVSWHRMGALNYTVEATVNQFTIVSTCVSQHQDPTRSRATSSPRHRPVRRRWEARLSLQQHRPRHAESLTQGSDCECRRGNGHLGRRRNSVRRGVKHVAATPAPERRSTSYVGHAHMPSAASDAPAAAAESGAP